MYQIYLIFTYAIDQQTLIKLTFFNQVTSSALEVNSIKANCQGSKKAIGCSVKVSGMPQMSPLAFPYAEEGCQCDQVYSGATCKAVCY